MSDIDCIIDVKYWFGLFTPEWYYDNTLDVYLSGVYIPYACEIDLCENWVEYFLHDINGIRLTESGVAVCERSYGEVTLKIRRA